MTDTKRLLARIGTARDAISRKEERTGLDYMIEGVLMECSVALKEQEKETNMVEVVRCKNCKNWYFADNRIPSEQENVCGRNGIVVTPDWYCADGERKDS